MAGKKIPQILTDAPVDQLKNWGGYSAKRDKTMLPANFLVEPSKNCFVPDGDKLVPRFGSQVVFQNGDPLDVGTIGKYTKFKNFAGIEMDVKAYRDSTEGEQVYVLFNNQYVPITTNPNTAKNGTGHIYFSTYTDSNLNLALSTRIPRLCWVNGWASNADQPEGVVFSWTGGIAVIDAVVGNVVSLPVGQTWRKLGFTINKAGTDIDVTINGVVYSSTTLSDLDTNSLTLTAAPTATTGDIITSAVEEDDLIAPMDMLRQSKNYMYYGNWKLRPWWMSNQFGRPSVTRINQSNAIQDDLIIDETTNYSGTGRNIYKLTIVSTDPAVDFEVQDFISPRGGTNAGFWDTGGYTGTGRNKYEIVVVSDMILTRQIGTQVGTFAAGEIILGGTSGARAQLLPGIDVTDFVGGNVALLDPSIPLQAGESITGESSGATMTLNDAQPQNSVKFFKNGQEYIPAGVTGQGTVYSYILAGPALVRAIDMDDGIIFNAPYDPINMVTALYTYQVGDRIILEIEQDAGGPDEFVWQKNNGATSTPANLQTTPVTIEDGIEVRWVSDRGHSVGDFWIIEVNQEIVRPWANFYYTIDFTSQQPLRRPGEGYIYNLPANFWTMDTLEEAMYVNTSNGDWGYSSPTLSNDLLSEDISFIPLKQVVASKVLYPYLTGHNRNDLLFIDENKNLTSLGRLIMMERLQMEDMSDFVLNLFQANSFVDGSIMFQDDKTWITSPEDDTMLVFDERMKYWQPPQIIPNLGFLTIIGTELYSHSRLNTATRKLNDPTADGDDGVEYEVIARTSTFDHGNRWIQKVSNMAFWEGYVDEAPPMKLSAYFDVNGCAGFEETAIIPVFCTDVKNNGNFGGSQEGGHEFGGDQTVRTNYARFQWNKLGVHHFYFSSLAFKCRTKRHTYQILSMGLNLAESKYNNKEYRPPESSIDSLLPLV